MFTDSVLRQASPQEELLGAFLVDASIFREYRPRLTAAMFGEYEWLYRVFCEVEDSEGLTFRGVANRCNAEQIRFLHGLKSAFYNEARLPYLIEQVKKKHLANRVLGIAQETMQRCLNEDDADDILRELQRQACELSTTESEAESDPERDVDAWAEYVLEIAKDPSKAMGMTIGLPSLDRITTGWHRTDLSVIGARTSMGKTAFMIENVLRLTKTGYKCAIFSLEMSKQQLYFRMMSNLMQVSFELFRLGRLAPNHYETMMRRKDELKSIYVDDTRGVTADYIADVMRRIKRTQGLDFVVVDYLQDVQEPGEQNDNSGSALARVCRKLRAAAQQCDCHVMGLSQIARTVESRTDKRPTNADLSGSTGIETSADVIALLYREDYYDPNTDKKNILEVNFTKQRNGKLGKVELYYDRDMQKISDIAR